MEFLVEFDVDVPAGAARSEVEERQSNEAPAAAKLAEEGHLVRIWKPPVAPGEPNAPELDWLNKGAFIAVGGRRPGGVLYETYLVG